MMSHPRIFTGLRHFCQSTQGLLYYDIRTLDRVCGREQ